MGSIPHFDLVPLFQFLNGRERALLAPACRVRVYERGDSVFEEGDPASDLCFVIFGRVKIVKAAPGREIILGLFGPGEPVGAVAVFEGRRFPASAIALEPTTVLRVGEREFFATLDAHPEISRRLLQGLMLRQFEISRRLADLSMPVERRVARLLLALSERLGKRDGETLVIPLALTRQEIADMTSTTVESAIRVMSRWAKENVVATRPDGFALLDVPALRAAADEPA